MWKLRTNKHLYEMFYAYAGDSDMNIVVYFSAMFCHYFIYLIGDASSSQSSPAEQQSCAINEKKEHRIVQLIQRAKHYANQDLSML